jgi:hypothetical protein
LAALLVIYAADWGAFEMRAKRHTATRTIQVDQFLATPLKGQKTEFDYLGAVAQTCARSIFPHASLSPCWWVERHATQWEK